MSNFAECSLVLLFFSAMSIHASHTKLPNTIFNNYSSSPNGNQNSIDHLLDFTKVLYSTAHYRSLLKYLETLGAFVKREYDAVGKSAEPYHLNES